MTNSPMPSLFPESTPVHAVGNTIFFIVMVLVIVAFLVFVIEVYWRVFTKAGRPGWASLIPVYNLIVLFKIAGLNPWLILLYLLIVFPILNLVVSIVLGVLLALGLAKSFGKSQTFALVGLFLFQFIGFAILAFGKAQYLGPGGMASGPDAAPALAPDASQAPPSTTEPTVPPTIPPTAPPTA